MYDTDEDIMARDAAEVEWATGMERAAYMFENPYYVFGVGKGYRGYSYIQNRLAEDDVVMDAIDEATRGYDLIRATITMNEGSYGNRIWTILVTHTSGCFEKVVHGMRTW